MSSDLWENGTAGILEEEEYVRAFFEDENDPAELIKKYDVVEMRREADTDPHDFTRENWEPIYVGEKFFVAPSWVEQPTPAGRFRLSIDDTTAFGTGRHESTKLMLQAMEEYLTPEMVVLDVGSGSGILSVGARELKAGVVFCCDIHPEAVVRAAFHFHLRSFVGSVDAVRGGLADLVLVNISAKIIDDLSADLKRVTKPGGHLLLSGFIAENTPSRYKPERTWALADWACWLCPRDSIDAPDPRNSDPLRPHPPQWW